MIFPLVLTVLRREDEYERALRREIYFQKPIDQNSLKGLEMFNVRLNMLLERRRIV